MNRTEAIEKLKQALDEMSKLRELRKEKHNGFKK